MKYCEYARYNTSGSVGCRIMFYANYSEFFTVFIVTLILFTKV